MNRLRIDAPLHWLKRPATECPATVELGHRRLRAFAEDLSGLQGRLMVTEKVQGIGGRKELREKLVRLYASIGFYGGRPTASQLERMDYFRTEIAKADGEFTELTDAGLAELNAALAERELESIHLLTEEEHAARGD